MTIHINSSGVDWRLDYNTPENGNEISIADLFSRIPDLQRDYADVSDELRYASVSELAANRKTGFRMKIRREPFLRSKAIYETLGYATADDGKYYTLTCPVEVFERASPQFIHTYLDKSFGTIPGLFIAEPFPGGARYSQLAVTYMVSFVLGMLVRYYPTHWMALVHGDRGDSLWPAMNRAQRLVEQSYPELVSEMVHDMAVAGHTF